MSPEERAKRAVEHLDYLGQSKVSVQLIIEGCIRAAVAEERVACARICADVGRNHGRCEGNPERYGWEGAAEYCAERVRARRSP